MNILGITHTISWNTAAALLIDGKIIGAAEEERFVRIKHAPRMIPHNAIDFVLQKGKLKNSDIDIIALSWDGLHNESDLKKVPKDKEQYGGNIQGDELEFWSQCIQKEKTLMNYLKNRFKNAKFHFVRHHLAHAASACYLSGFNDSLFLTLDGRGEFESGTMGIFKNGEIEIIKSFRLDESLGHLYSTFTWLSGFRSHTDEGKMMGLAPYGKSIPSLKDIVQVSKENEIKIDWGKINSIDNSIQLSNDPTKDERKNFAATVQQSLEKCVLELVSNLKTISNSSNICLAGGTALNIDINGALLSSQIIKKIFVQPASHDAGGALGSALFISKQLEKPNFNEMKDACLGPKYDNELVEPFLENTGVNYKRLEDTPKEIAKLLSEDKIVAWMQGRLEFGPRALGSRSLLANPTKPEMWKKVNKVKGREYWRPLAPSIIEEQTERFFDNFNSKSPFMTIKFGVKEEMIEKIPAVVHVDKSVRAQTVSKKYNHNYWKLLTEFENITNIPVLINTSLNLRGEPIVNSPKDALKTFFSSEIDFLCINDFLVSK